MEKRTYYNVPVHGSQTWRPFLPLKRASHPLWYKERQLGKNWALQGCHSGGKRQSGWMCASHYKPHRGSSLALATLLLTEPPTPHLEAVTLPRVPSRGSLPQMRHLAMALPNHSPAPTVPKLVFSCHSCDCCHIPLQLVL